MSKLSQCLNDMRNGKKLRQSITYSDTSDLIKLGNPTEIINLCSKYNIPLDYSVCDYLIEIDDIEAMSIIVNYDGFRAWYIYDTLLKIKSDNMMLLIVKKTKSNESFFFSFNNKFMKTVKYMYNNNLLLSFHIAVIFDSCDLELLNFIGIDLSKIGLLSIPCPTNHYYKRIKTYGKIDEFDLEWNLLSLKIGVESWMSMIESNYITFTCLNKLSLNHRYKKDELINFAIENTINLPIKSKTCSYYFNIILPEIIIDYLIRDITKLVVQYL